MIVQESKYVFMFLGKPYEVEKLIEGDDAVEEPIGAVVDFRGTKHLVLNREYPNLVNERTPEINANFSERLFRIH